MVISAGPRKEEIWRCLHCHGQLTLDPLGLGCIDCGRQYPVIAEIPILVREPAAYLRAEFSLLARASREAKQRKGLLEKMQHDFGLPDATVERHRDVLDADIAQVEAFIALLEPATKALASLTVRAAEAASVPRSGWMFETLLPYLLRDWTDTPELKAANAVIGGALRNVFPDPAGKSIAFAGCGAAGLLDEISPAFGRVMGFDLTLPILAAARHLLDGKSLELAVPHYMNELGLVTLLKRDPQSTHAPAELLAMDALDMAFADGSIDCVITAYLIDLIPDPRRLADEIHRVLSSNGVWINYGPSGPLKSLWRFDRAEGAAFAEAAGFTVVLTEAHRTTNLDVSRACPPMSFRNLMCYLIAARKVEHRRAEPSAKARTPSWAELPGIVPQHFPGAILIQRQSLGTDERKVFMRRERIPGHVENLEINGDTARIIAFVDGERTVREIADLLTESLPTRSVEETYRDFAQYFEQHLLNWGGNGQRG